MMKKMIFTAILLIIAIFAFGCQQKNAEVNDEVTYISIDDLIAEQGNETNATVTETPAEQESQVLIAEPETTEEKAAEEEQPATEQPQPTIEAAPAEEKPEYAGLPRITVTEGEKVSFPNLNAEDPDGDPISYTFTEPLDNKGEWLTQPGDAGEYKITITASDGETEVSQEVVIEVLSLNKAPVIENLPSVINVKEGDTISLEPKVSDADGDRVTVTYSGYMDSASKITNYEDAGTKEVTVTATDGISTSVQSVRIEIANFNRAPILQPINKVSVTEGETVIVGVKATDADNDNVEIKFDSPLDKEGTWQTKEGDAGDYNIRVVATDGQLESTQMAKVSVISLNKAPVLEMIDNIEVEEGDAVMIEARASDPDGEDVEITFSGWMDKPVKQTGYDDAGVYTVTVTVSDGKSSTTQEVAVTVKNKNRPPVFTGIV